MEKIKIVGPRPERQPMGTDGNLDSFHKEEFLFRVLDKIEVPVVYIDIDYRYKYVNQAYAEWYSTDRAKVIGAKVESFLGQKAYAYVKPYMDEAFSGRVVRYEQEVPFRDGTRYVKATYTPDFDERGKVKGYVAVVNDISAQKKVEKELVKSHLYYEKVLTALPVAVYTCDKEGRITFFNDVAVSLWGYAPDVTDDSLRFCACYKVWGENGKLIPPDKTPMAISLATGQSFRNVEAVIERPNGEKFHAILSIDPLLDQEGTVCGAVNIFQDISNYKHAEESKAMLAAIVQFSEDAIISKTTHGIITSWNPAAEKLYGYTEAEMLGKPISRLIPFEYNNEEPEILERIKKGERVEPFETKRITKDGQLIDVSLTVSPIRDAAGNVIGASNIAHDISRQKESLRLIYENEERLRMASESANLGSWEFLPASRKLIWSDECKRIYGLDLSKEPDNEFVDAHDHPEDKEFIRREVRKALDPNNNEDFKIEYRIIRATDKQLRWVKIHGKAYFDKRRRPQRFIGTMMDITKEKLQSERLKESIEMFQTMVDNAPAMIWMSGTDKFHDYFNRTWLDFTGRSSTQESKDGWIGGVHIDDLERCIETYTKALKNQEGFYAEYRLRRHDGEYRWVANNCMPRFSPDGVFLGFISASIDIDDQKRFREKIQDSELLFKTISSTSPAALWMTDRNKSTIFVNDTWLKWTSGVFDDQLNIGWVSALHPEDREKVVNQFIEAFDEGKYFSTEFRLLSADGSVRWCLTEGRPYHDINGAFAGYAGSVTDITEIKKLEQRKDDFIKMASHELKTPITSINGYVQLLMNIHNETESGKLQMAASTVKSSLGTIAKQVSKLSRLVSELLDLSKIDSGKLELHCTEFDFGELVEETVHDSRFTATRHAIILENNFKGKVFGDKDRIGQVLTNVLNNGIKYSPHGSQVEVHVEGDESSVAIRVKDYGIGIDKKEHKRIFERFYRVEGKLEQTYPGFGIGLFIADEIIRRHHGSIHVKSEKEKGSVFTIHLPLDFRHE